MEKLINITRTLAVDLRSLTNTIMVRQITSIINKFIYVEFCQQTKLDRECD
ncbi:MAG: hypothetical protein KME32_15315 [Mojavia pulchra JT2-VF2]|uniref:Uncharacterized protein n=1 Tax=Mojavia pulchra JT2-VF2 TaxID=287848 RepID=A0A951UGM0_9NOST|nr:hypothetical protein [Mojavia pulchra JT2-VF2]